MSLSSRGPLFYPRVFRRHLAEFVFSDDLSRRSAILQKWVLALRAGKLDAAKEVNLHGEFLTDVFGRALGYQTLTTSGAGGWDLLPTAPGGTSFADELLPAYAPTRKKPLQN